MLKKTSLFFCLVLSIILCVSGLSLAYNEAPELKEMVMNGELPSIEDRLPVNPKVVEPYHEIGKYGGTLNTRTIRRWLGADGTWSQDHLLIVGYDGEIYPDIVENYIVSDDYKVFTFKIREGIKYDDGNPLTVEDVEFYYEDILNNKDITPVFPSNFKRGGEKAELVKLNDYEFKLIFKEPHYSLLYSLGAFYAPKHYLKKYHINYNKDANKLADEEGYSSWFGAIENEMGYMHLNGNPIKYPVIAPWTVSELKSDEFTLSRNPYYHKVDPEGNQYPYINEINVKVISSGVYELQAMSELVDIAVTNTMLGSYPMYMENREKGNYQVYTMTAHPGADPGIGLNLNHEDPNIREIFHEKKFREALSYAINREEINEALAFGKAVPRQATITNEASFFKEKWSKAYAEYNPEKANELLDEIGLVDQTGNGYRDRFDGDELVLVVEVVDVGSRVPVLEMVERYWDNIGIKTEIQVRARELYRSRVYSGQHMAGTWGIDQTMEIAAWTSGGSRFWLPGEGNLLGIAPRWGYWLIEGEDHELAEEPPDYVIDIYNTYREWQRSGIDTSKYKELGQKIWDFHYENLWIIGTVGHWPQPVLAAKNLKNIPIEMYEDRPPQFDHFRNLYKKFMYQFYFAN